MLLVKTVCGGKTLLVHMYAAETVRIILGGLQQQNNVVWLRMHDMHHFLNLLTQQILEKLVLLLSLILVGCDDMNGTKEK